MRAKPSLSRAATVVAAVLSVPLFGLLADVGVVAAAPVEVPAPAIRITEFSYQLRGFGEAEFVELTNVGTTSVNM
ncbi:MAG TPA: hypothetical protein PLV68_07655, partial [Ilumatobacteraceae bacterium]|nr:hypothetical protein [Ilumatobacteraceae bacterium]